MMTANACGVKIEEIVYDPSQHSSLLKLDSGIALLTSDGQCLTQTTAILERIVPANHAMLGGSDPF